MRPAILFPLFAQPTALPGIGPRFAKLLERLTGPAVVGLCWHLPTGIVDRRVSAPLAAAPAGAVVTLVVQVEAHLKPGQPRHPFKVRCRGEDGGRLELVFFNARPDWIERLLPVGDRRAVSGRVERYGDMLQMAHPDHVVPAAELPAIQVVEPVYGLTAGLPPKLLVRAVHAALERAPELPDWLDPEFRRRTGWSGWREALLAAHRPQGAGDLEPGAPARRRLAYDELLAGQLAMALVRAQLRRRPGRVLSGDGRLRARAVAALPFALTGSQQAALAEIVADMAEPRPMLRLLQGDVGSGKTVVALLAMLNAVEAGAQAALLAPTEILARQHHATIAPLAQAAGVEAVLLTGRDKGAARAGLLAGLASGATRLAIGTHALVQDDVGFADLGLAVVDEQHRFGVQQRLGLAAKGRAVDLLVMSATPIPRTLMLASYGDLDVSRLTEKPAGRKPVATRALPLERLEEVVAAVGRAVAAGDRVYWVCPLVEESESLDIAAAGERHAVLQARFGARVGLVHGRLKAAERDAAMEDFARGRTAILVATTVIEVGVDVPAATVMVVEHAERFGLAQLHQLRGRIGRGERPSSCLLLYQAPLGSVAESRLRVLRETDDGFRIAEEDLRLRGAGDLLGNKQSGLPAFRLADLSVHADLLATARDDARLVVERDPQLESPRGEALRTLLYLFERDAVVGTLRSG
ncbi:MAG: ATP-dependent DNA helicase RecG [Dongiaceae bacterium]